MSQISIGILCTHKNIYGVLYLPRSLTNSFSRCDWSCVAQNSTKRATKTKKPIPVNPFIVSDDISQATDLRKYSWVFLLHSILNIEYHTNFTSQLIRHASEKNMICLRWNVSQSKKHGPPRNFTESCGVYKNIEPKIQ